MKDWQERVIEEKRSLDWKRHDLQVFIGSNVFPGLPEPEQERLLRQSKAMSEYSGILGERIAAFAA